MSPKKKICSQSRSQFVSTSHILLSTEQKQQET